MIYFIPNRFIFIHESDTVRCSITFRPVSGTAIPIKAMNLIITNLLFFKLVWPKTQNNNGSTNQYVLLMEIFS